MMLEKISREKVEIDHLLLQTEDFSSLEEELGNLEDEYDNPQRMLLDSNFLETYVEASSSLMLGCKIKNKLSKSVLFKEKFDKNSHYCYEMLKVEKEAINHEVHKENKNRYKFLERIGGGSFGEVFKAKDLLTGKMKAIKVTKLRQNGFRNHESKMLAKCCHPNIIEFDNYFECNQFGFLVMEFCGGTSIEELTKAVNYICNLTMVKEITKQILKGLVYLHGKSIVHRDIKLENIVLFWDKGNPIVKIIDFGNSEQMEFEINKVHQIYGTTVYMPPESFSGWYSHTFDIWSCGVVLHILLTGFCPFKRKSRQETEELIKNLELNFDEQFWWGIPKPAKDLLERMLSKDHLKRPSANECLNHKWLKE